MKKRELTTPNKILQAALAKEEEARDFYGDLATQCRLAFVRDLLEKLHGEECKHVRMIHDMITKLDLGKDIL